MYIYIYIYIINDSINHDFTYKLNKYSNRSLFPKSLRLVYSL